MIECFKLFGKLLKPYLKYGKVYLFGSLVLVVIMNPISTFASVFMLQTLLDSISAGYSFVQLLLLILFFQLLLFISTVSSDIWYRLYGEKKFIKISSYLNREIMEKILRVDYVHFDDPKYYNAYTWAAKEYASKVEGSRQVLVGIFSSFFIVISLTAYISTANFLIFLVTVVVLIIVLFLNTIINKQNIDKQEQTLKDNRKINYVQSVFNTKERIGELLSTNIHTPLFEIYDQANNSKISKIENFNKRIMGLNISTNLLLNCLNIFVMAFLSWQAINNMISLGEFVSMLTASNYLRGNLQRLFNGYKQTHEFAVYSKKIQEFLELDSRIESHSSELQESNSDIIIQKPYSVKVENLSFTYPNSNFVLHDINIAADKGERIAIVGENGVGKTTLTKLILRLYDPHSGTVMFNGVDVRELPIKALRLEIGVAFQKTGVYALPFIDNVKAYALNADENSIQEAIDMFGFPQVFEKTGATMHTELTKEFDKKGIVLSQGEIQRLALAKLFTKQFGLLILDEASSALDPIAEYELNKKLLELAHGTTTIMIAHRLSSIRDVDRIYVLSEGTVAEVGNHFQLMEQKGIYYNMFTKQAENYRK